MYLLMNQFIVLTFRITGIFLYSPVAAQQRYCNTSCVCSTLLIQSCRRFLLRVAEKEGINKMSLHNLATVFGPTLLRPSEKDSKIPTNPTQPISMGDSWSLEVMAQVHHKHLHLAFCLWAFRRSSSLLIASLRNQNFICVCSVFLPPSLQVQVLLYFLQLETIPTPDSKRQSILFSTEV